MAKIASHRFQGIAGRSNIERPTSNVEWEKMKVKILAQRTWLWFAPWKGALHDSALLNILMECWPPARRAYGSERVMEYWKNENPTPIFCNLEQRPSRFSDA
jgi:hypothetical protein